VTELVLKDNLPFFIWASSFKTVPQSLFLNGKWQMANFRFFQREAPNRFERFTVFKPPALPEVTDS